MAREEIVNTLTQSVLLEQSVLHPTLVIDSEFQLQQSVGISYQASREHTYYFPRLCKAPSCLGSLHSILPSHLHKLTELRFLSKPADKQEVLKNARDSRGPQRRGTQTSCHTNVGNSNQFQKNLSRSKRPATDMGVEGEVQTALATDWHRELTKDRTSGPMESERLFLYLTK